MNGCGIGSTVCLLLSRFPTTPNSGALNCFAVNYLRAQQHSRRDGDGEVADDEHDGIQVTVEIEIVVEVDDSDVGFIVAGRGVDGRNSENPN